MLELARCECGRLSRVPCRRSVCAAWRRAAGKLADLFFVPTEIAYSKACGKFVVPL